MNTGFSIHQFSLATSGEVDDLIASVAEIAREHLLVHIATYLHNTVMIQNLIHGLTKQFEGVEIVPLHTERDAKTEIIVYTYDDTMLKEEPAALPQDIFLFHSQMQRSRLSEQVAEAKHQLVKRYFIDTLTNLPNLYKLRHDLQENSDYSFVLINIDNFKLINDFYGFVVGDFILEQLSVTISEYAKEMQVYRMSADEFAILIDNPMDFYSLKAYLFELSEHFKHRFYRFHDTQIYIDITMASTAGRNHEDIFSKVGMALKYAKEMQLPFWIYEDRMHFEHQYENNLKTALKVRKAIEKSGIIPYFQPIVNNETGAIEKFECLSRLLDEDGLILSPTMFIDIAKKIKVYNQVTKTIIEKSFEVFASNSYDFSINLSIEDVMSQEIYDFIIAKLQDSGMGERVIFELLESEAVEDYKKVSRFITEVKRYGARVAIDDFGSGFSNFAYLTKIDVDYIKIDGSLIKDIDSSSNSYIITQTIVSFAQKMKIKTIAEFVHSSTVMAKVKQMGIDYSQGYHIDEPLPTLPE
ncbi:MAG: bifunctional diguanylate cyclase/phosphodiesterase [Campylobacterota bacterium]|nr:bifunctional diguanylate cyclase/phosphodiesterase [Campylobacterota bacterium]